MNKALTVGAGVPGPEIAGSPLFPTTTRRGDEVGVRRGPDTAAPSEPEGPRSDGPAWQILATLARAMRCGEDDFGDAADRITAVLDGGRWSAAALATHLVDFVVGGVMVAGADPADS
nr:hypothetical protein [Micromonospora sp. DSM 115978]